jgi:hypothetical protein
MPVMAAGANEEELEKRLGAALLAGQPLICIDNVNGELKGDALCQTIERPLVEIRILGKSERVRIEARATTTFCTGNNIAIVGDLCRRVTTITLDPMMESPETREFNNSPVASRGRGSRNSHQRLDPRQRHEPASGARQPCLRLRVPGPRALSRRAHSLARETTVS